jgi:peptide/nickel transport system ATP-binding protein
MTTPDVAPVLEVANLRKVYPTRGGQQLVAVDDVSFAVPTGGSLAIVGESGSGKTTIAKMLVGLEPLTGGRVSIHGQDRSRWDRSARARRQRGREV